MDRVDRLTQRLLGELDRAATEHTFGPSDAHLDGCLVCLNRFVALRDDMQAVAAARPASRRLRRRLDELVGHDGPRDVESVAFERVRRLVGFRIPAWTAATAAALIVLAWATTAHVPVVKAPQNRLTPAHQQGARTITGVVSAIQDATSNGVEAHVLSLRDPSGAMYLLFTWGAPTVKPGDTVEIVALVTSDAEGKSRGAHQGVVTELRRAK